VAGVDGEICEYLRWSVRVDGDAAADVNRSMAGEFFELGG
jgi:hypothetical protein